MKKSVHRMLALMLVVVMCLSGTMTAFADTSQTSAGNKRSITIEDLDPSTLKVEKLGENKESGKAITYDGQSGTYKPEDILRVSIVLDDPSTMDAGYSAQSYTKNKSAIAYRNSLKQKQAAVTNEINAKLGKTLDVKWNLTFAVNIISANVQYKDINRIKLVSGVKDVFIENRYEALKGEASPNTSNTSEYMVGATAAWASGYTGAGSRIAIIDTGLDLTHQSFDAEAFEYSIGKLGKAVDLMTAADIPSSELNGAGVYKTSKVPYAYNYVDKNTTNLGHIVDEASNHGSHVAGIAAANRYIKTDNGFVDAASSVYAVGMAPDAQILVMKVFGVGGGAYDSDYMVAIEDALIMECDAVNLSLGSGSQGWTFSDYYQDVMNSLSNNSNGTKTVVTISAGNAGSIMEYNTFNNIPYLYSSDASMDTVGSPGSFVNSFTVASADNIGNTGKTITFNNTLNAFYTDTSKAGILSIAGEHPYVFIDAVGEAEDYAAVDAAVDLTGKVIIVNRGEINFSDKGNNAIPYDPAAVIIANNQPGSLNMTLDGFTGTFPMVLIGYYDALAIMDATEAQTAGSYKYYTGTLVVNTTDTSELVSDNADVSSFSSWGVPGSLIMKPEITAPGGDIYSVNGTSIAPDDSGTGPSSYVSYSGTSMAAPHMAGLSGVLAQYLNEDDITAKNAELAAKYSRRAIMQSLLMSTAQPMFMEDEGDYYYYPILQQGAGLANVDKALNAKSVIMVGDEDDTLTAITGAAADGKVKVEFGDDLFSAEDGSRQYSFTIYNTYDKDLEYDLDTDIFTQMPAPAGSDIYMLDYTLDIDWNVTYDYEKQAEESHDVDKNGITNADDVQAILDSLTGIVATDSLDIAAGDLDEDGVLSSYDAYLLLKYVENIGKDLVVPAGGSKTVTVTITPDSEDLELLSMYYPNGFYLEGFTYVSTKIEEADGAYIEEEHSIPLLGYIGSWTDPSMYDNTSYTDVVYGTDRIPYTGNTKTNYLTVSYNGVTKPFIGNPYIVEEEFPADRLAINSRSTINSVCYNLIRAAANMYFAVSTDEGVVDAKSVSEYVDGIWYSQSQGAWQNMGTKVYNVNKAPRDYGLEEGDIFRAGLYAIPEYYGIVLNWLLGEGIVDGPDGGYISSVNNFKILLQYGFFGSGSYIGYDFLVDDTAPVINSEATALNGDTLTVSASDNNNLAYVAVMSLDGTTKYAEEAPGTATAELEFDISEAIEKEKGYVAVFVADYAGNETAVAIQVNDEVGDVDPYSVSTITIDPVSLDLYKGNVADIISTISPVTATVRTVTWTSSDESVATVDANGRVTAVAAGSAVITATADGDETKTATCTVKVTSVDQELDAIIWDEEGGVYFSSFNTSTLPAWNRLHSEKLGVQMMTAFAGSEGLYAASMDTSSATSKLYAVSLDPEAQTVETEELGDVYAGAFDMAPTVFGDVYFVYPYAKYVIFGNLMPEEDEEEGTFCGFPYGLLDVSTTFGNGVYAIGVAAKSFDYDTGDSEYYILDMLGRIWITTMSITEEGIVFSTPSLVIDTKLEASLFYQNLYYDGSYIYWSRYADNTSELLMIDPETKKIYHAGDFGDGVWPVSGIFEPVDYSAEAGDYAGKKIDIKDLTPVASAEQLRSEEFDAFVAAEAAKLASKQNAAANEEPANKANGGLNTIKKTLKPAAMVNSGESSSSTVTVMITEEMKTTNGLYLVKYDPSNMTWNKEKSVFNVDKYSAADDENGTITFAFADYYGLAAGDEIAIIAFDVTGSEASDVTIITEERNDELGLSESESETPAVTATYLGASLTLKGNIKLNFYVSTPEEGWTAEMTFEKDGSVRTVALTSDIYSSSVGGYKIEFTGLSAKEMTEHVILVIKDKNGNQVQMFHKKANEYIKEMPYAIVDYVNLALAETEDSDEAALMKAILNYGESAQKQFSHKLDDLANPEGYLAEEMDKPVGDFINPDNDAVMPENAREDDAIGFKGGSLMLKDATSIRLYFKNEITSATIDDETAEIKHNSNGYYVERKDIASKDLDTKYTFKVTTGGEEYEFAYCALSWCNDTMRVKDYESDWNICKALYLYNKAANVFFEKD